jgi:hypothetical protein
MKRFLQNYEPAIAAAIATLFVAVVDALFIVSTVLPISLFVLIPWADPLSGQWYLIVLVACLSLLLYYCVGRVVHRLLGKHLWRARTEAEIPSKPRQSLATTLIFVAGQAAGVLLWIFSDTSMAKMMSIEGTLLLTCVTFVPYLLGSLGVWKRK